MLDYWYIVKRFCTKYFCRFLTLPKENTFTKDQLCFSSSLFSKTTSFNRSINVSVDSSILQNIFLATKSSTSVFALETLWMELAENCAHDWFFSQLKLKFSQNYRLRFFKQCLNQRFSANKIILDCPILCLVHQNGNLIQEIVKKSIFVRMIPINGIDSFETTLSNFSIMVLINNRGFTEYCPMILFLEQILGLQTYWTDMTKMSKSSDFSWKTKLHFAKSTACIPSIYQSTTLQHLEFLRECQFLHLVTSNANLIGGKCQYLPIGINCPDNQLSFFQIEPLSYRNPNQQICNSIA